jgi:hypothetical protein
MAKKYCCGDIEYAIKDRLVFLDPNNVYSIDNPENGMDIKYCPWCGALLKWPW